MPEDQKNKKVFIKHNKKRNAGLLFEFLAKFIAENSLFDEDQSNVYVEMMLRYFDPKTSLGKELEVVRYLSERKYNSKELASKAIFEFKDKFSKINHTQSDIEKSNLIKEINYTIGSDLYSTDVPRYRLYTSIYSLGESVKNRNYSLESEYEELVLENLLSENKNTKQDDFISEVSSLPDEEYSDAVLFLMSKKINENIDDNIHLFNEDQKRILKNYAAQQNGDISSDVFDSFIRTAFSDLYNKFHSLKDHNPMKEGLVKEKLDSMLEIFNDFESVCHNIDDVTELTMEGFNVFDEFLNLTQSEK